MIYESNLQVLPLRDIEGGHTCLIVVTNAQSAVTLQFRHSSDQTYRDHPDFTAIAPVGTVVSKAVICCSSDMRLSFAAAPGAVYYATSIPTASATF